MAIYNGTQKVAPSGIKAIYNGTQKVYEKVTEGWKTIYSGSITSGNNFVQLANTTAPIRLRITGTYSLYHDRRISGANGRFVVKKYYTDTYILDQQVPYDEYKTATGNITNVECTVSATGTALRLLYAETDGYSYFPNTKLNLNTSTGYLSLVRSTNSSWSGYANITITKIEQYY